MSALEIIYHLGIPSLVVAGIGGMAALLLRISNNLSSLNGQFNLLMTNHLPHLQAEVSELRNQFIEHIGKAEH